MYVLKAKPKICTPHSSQTDEPRIIKLDMEHLGPYLTPSAKFGSDRLAGARAVETRFHVDFGLFPFSLSHYFDKATARTAGPILMVDGSNDVCSRKGVHAFEGSHDHVTPNVGVAA
jgi:hypothetical protein